MADINWCDGAQAYVEEQLSDLPDVDVIRRNERMVIVRMSKAGEPPAEFIISQVDLILDGGSDERMRFVCDGVVTEVRKAVAA